MSQEKDTGLAELNSVFFQETLKSLVERISKSNPSKFHVNGHLGYQVSIEWNGEASFERLFDGMNGWWKVFWRGKGEKSFRVAWDSLISGRQPLSISSVDDIRVYGGIPFDEDSEHDAYWREFRAQFFFLPQVEWHIGETSSLSLRLLEPLEVKVSASAEEVRARLIDILMDLVSRSSVNIEKSQLKFQGAVEEPSKSEWIKSIEDAKSTIHSGALSKVVMSRSLLVKVPSEARCSQLLAALDQKNELSYLFAFQAPSGLAFLSRSPERILSWCEQEVQVDAIAGTRARNTDPIQDAREAMVLQGSLKDRSEHRSVTNFVERVLAEHCGSYKIEEATSLLKLKHVQHMITRYRGTLKHRHPIDLLCDLHPTPAVSGMPKLEAVSYLRQYEPLQRGWFAGSVGWMSSCCGDFAIGIRSALLDRNILRIFAGAGIVSGSDPESEWFETQEKMKNFTEIFNLSDLCPPIEEELRSQ